MDHMPPTTPSQQPTPPGQPPAPSTSPSNHPDTLGIVGLVMAFVGLQVIGLILGLVGASHAKREGRSPALSRAAWIINLILIVIITIVAGLLVLIVINYHAAHPVSSSAGYDQPATTAQTTDGLHTVTQNGFALTVPNSYVDIPEAYSSADASYSQGDDSLQMYTLVIKESRADFDTTATIEDYARAGNSQYDVSDETITPLHDLSNPHGYTTTDYTITGVTSHVRVVYYIRYVATSDSFYQIVCWTTPSHVAAVAPSLAHIIESFQEQ